MASYFDEHDCEPLQAGEQPNHMLHMARLLLDGGYAREWELDYENISGGAPPPPASKKIVDHLPSSQVTEDQAEKELKCPVCLLEYEERERINHLPCKHHFHPSCIVPWLQKTNSCPVCRHELPTDDENYEELKRQKARQKQREFELESLHDSMFG